MTKGILGKKVGMTQVFTDNGELVPVTVIDVTPNVVMQVKTLENDGYSAVQLGFDDKREVLSNKPEQGHAAKANTTPKRFIGEIRDAELGDDIKVGDKVAADIFAEGETRSTLLVPPRVMVTKVTSIRTANGVGQWRTVLVTTVAQVHLVPSSTTCSRVRSCQVGWVTTPGLCNTCGSLRSTLKTTFS